MPLYDFQCEGCGLVFERQVSLSEYDEPQSCESCGCTKTTRKITAVGFILRGDNGWTTRAGRVRKQMEAKNRRLAAKEREQKGDGLVPRLAPNVGGERVESWSEAKKLAASKGKNTASYEPYVRKEKAGDL